MTDISESNAGSPANAARTPVSADRPRFDGLDQLKCLCAFFVVCIHVPFPDAVSRWVDAVFRVAVPVFFMITGFFYRTVAERGREKRQIGKIARLFALSLVLYFFYSVLLAFRAGTLGQSLGTWFSGKALLDFVFLNDVSCGGHLWYLGALLYALLILYALRRAGRMGEKILFCLLPVLMIAELVFGSYASVVFGRTFPHVYVRNFLFTGLPYLAVGMGMDRLLRSAKESVRRFRPLLGCGILVFSVTSVLEKQWLVSVLGRLDREHYISSILLSVCLFLFFASSERSGESKAGRLIAFVGRRYATDIYVFHPIVRYAVLIVLTRVGLSSVFDTAGAPIVFLGSAAVAAAVTGATACFRRLTDRKK